MKKIRNSIQVGISKIFEVEDNFDYENKDEELVSKFLKILTELGFEPELQDEFGSELVEY